MKLEKEFSHAWSVGKFLFFFYALRGADTFFKFIKYEKSNFDYLIAAGNADGVGAESRGGGIGRHDAGL